MRHARTPQHRPPRTVPLRAGIAGVLAAGLLAVPSAPAVADSDGDSDGDRAGRDLVASSRAVPTPAHPVAADYTAVWSRLLPNDAPVQASAVAESACASCAGTAVTLQVLTAVGNPAIRADNLALSRTTGDGAASAAVSVQVIAAATARSVAASNRAIAVNTDCTDCTAGSIAIQFVLVGGPQRTLSDQAREAVEAIEQELSLRLWADQDGAKEERSGRDSSAAHAAADRAGAIIAADTGAGIETHIDVDDGD